jgi:predicted lipid-binding transport protein (Tim44 family)
MAQAGSARPATPASRSRLWQGPLVAGLCFGLAYGVTQRLIHLNVGDLIRFGQNFDVQVFPGTSLESLRLRFGEAAGEARGELELNELERQQAEEAKRQEALKPVPADPAVEPGEPLGQEEPTLELPAEPVPAAPVAAPAAPPAPPAAPVPPPQP